MPVGASGPTFIGHSRYLTHIDQSTKTPPKTPKVKASSKPTYISVGKLAKAE